MRTSSSFVIKNKLSEFMLVRRAQIEIETRKKYTATELYKDVAAYCGITSYSLQTIVSASTSCSLIVALRLSEYFNTTVNELFYYEEKPEVENEEHS